MNDYEIVVAGVASMLRPYEDRVSVVELDSGVPTRSKVDLILYDTFGQVQGDAVDLDHLARHNEARVVIFSWNVQPELVQRAIQRGAAGYLSKGMSADQIVQALEAIHGGETVTPAESAPAADSAVGVWPGQEYGLTARESEILALIVQGLSNQEIAERTYLSINSVKTYIRTGYRKIGVSRRSQAVAWGMTHGLQPDRMRRIDSRSG